jgi:hypothetical protein
VTGQSAEWETSSRSLYLALGLSIFLVYVIMASQFESLVYPLIILVTIPLAAVGVIWALLLLGLPVSVLVFLGAILLAGIVVNNAIVLVDYAGQLKARGHSTEEALAMAGPGAPAADPDDDADDGAGAAPDGAGARRRRRAAHADGDHGDRGARLLDAADADRDPDDLRGGGPAVRRGGGEPRDLALARGAAVTPRSWRPRRRCAVGQSEPGEPVELNGAAHGDDNLIGLRHLSLVRPVTMLMVLLSFIVLGIVALVNIPIELIPAGFSPPFMQVEVPYANATAQDIEDRITRPLEQALSTTPGSTS